jgi:hypothetical protein
MPVCLAKKSLSKVSGLEANLGSVRPKWLHMVKRRSALMLVPAWLAFASLGGALPSPRRVRAHHLVGDRARTQERYIDRTC